ncbi:hypothetical protein AVEN_158190-1 [Araneus ventricosus]|uniref:Uncharacterized protein n=1 Tax=Araneus ventricosus TaxID=182803 RepID=A0A4Y2G7J2_ARAVE|nr:hypothetical protein AVEN_158190-1 [Araneus ventricosus]
MTHLKLEIHGRTVPHHLERYSPDSSSFQPIHLFIEAPSKRHNRSLQSPRATGPTIPPAFERDSPSRFPERASLPLPHAVFAFLREACSPLPTIVFQFYGLVRRMETGIG